MPQETITLVNNLSDKFLTAQDDINNNFDELYAATPPSLTGNALKFLRVNAGETAVEWATVAGGGDVTKVGTPVNNQVGVWTGDGTIQGDSALTFNTSTDKLTVDGRVHTRVIESHTNAGLLIEANGGADVALFGASGGQSATFYDGVKLDASTASRILSTDASKNITALDTTTYPDLTELSYIKGLSSAVQTQITNKPDDFLELTDTPSTYAGQGLKLVRVNATPNALEFVTANSSLVGLGNVANVDTTTTANITDSSGKRFVSDAQLTVIGNTSGTNTGDQTTISGNAGTATTLQTSRLINTVSFNGSADINVDANKVTQSYLGGGCLVSDIQGFLTSSSGNALNNQQIIFIAKPLLKNETISGFKFRIQISGVFVGNNNNKAGAYELNPATGLLTKRAESANNQTIWKQSTAILNTVSFVTPYAFTAGVIYFAFLYCRSSQTTAPSILRASASSPDQYAGVSLDFPNSIKLYGSLSSQTDLPATVNMSSITVSTNNFWCQGF